MAFSTSLANGAGINEYLAFFGGGQDSALYCIGFHAISASSLNGDSLAGLYEGGDVGASMLTIINFLDTDQNGLFDQGEMLLAGWDFLVEGGGFSGMFTSGAGGELLIPLQVGEYTVTAQEMAGYTFTTPFSYTVAITEGMGSSLLFGNIPEPATLILLAAGAGLALRRRRR